jgi:hypothetical protein
VVLDILGPRSDLPDRIPDLLRAHSELLAPVAAFVFLSDIDAIAIAMTALFRVFHMEIIST